MGTIVTPFSIPKTPDIKEIRKFHERVANRIAYQTSATTPVYNLVPRWIGDLAFETTNSKWYIAVGLANTSWESLTEYLRNGDVFDDFSRSDRLLDGDISASGNEWSLTGAGGPTATITDGLYKATDNTYAYIDPGRVFTRIEGAFSFEEGSGYNYPHLADFAMIMDSSRSNPIQDMLHLNFGPTTWSLTKRISGGSFDGVLFGTYELQTDGTVYGVTMEVDGTTVTVVTPDGVISSATVSELGSTIIPRYGAWQIGSSLDSYKGRWNSIRITDRKPETMAVLSGCAPAIEVTRLKGEDGNFRQRTSFSIEQAGWYRIATEKTLTTLSMSGSVRLSCKTSLIEQIWEFTVDSWHGAASPTITNVFKGRDAVIDQARISTHLTGSSGAYIVLDIHLASAGSTTIEAEFKGLFTTIQIPVPGAIALTTGSNTLSF